MNTKNNKLIAEFLGYNIWSWDNENFYITKGVAPNETNHNIKSLKFHYNWDWLMEVVDKIETIEDGSFDVVISQDIGAVYRWELNETISADESSSTKIEKVYNACVEFIKWYNKNKS